MTGDLFDKCRKYDTAEKAKELGFYPYFRPLESAQGTEVCVDGNKMVMLGSNNYLGLTDDERVMKASIKAIEKYGAGCAGSRFLNGNLDLHNRLENELAKFVHKDAGLLFSTGFQTNLGIIQALIGRKDIVITDKWDHASIIDGCRLSFGKMEKFEHNDMADLEETLQRCQGANGILIVVDGIFSMEGDIANLPDIVKLAKKYKARVMVDDAHALGVLGKNGRGTAEHFGLESEVDIIMGTFSKSLASLGGFIAADKKTIDYVRHNARSLIFSAAIPPANAAAALKSLEIIQAEPQRREQLWKNTQKMMDGLKSMGYDIGESCTPIIPLLFHENERSLEVVKNLPGGEQFVNLGLMPTDIMGIAFWRFASEHGLFINIVMPPAVPPGRTLIRTSYIATHTDKQLDFALDVFSKVGKQLAIIP
ncbi:MAG: pyridoxal phosphate-dependent aminotransferase family protein [Elusimicrobiota bacterium]